MLYGQSRRAAFMPMAGGKQPVIVDGMND